MSQAQHHTRHEHRKFLQEETPDRLPQGGRRHRRRGSRTSVGRWRAASGRSASLSNDAIGLLAFHRSRVRKRRRRGQKLRTFGVALADKTLASGVIRVRLRYELKRRVISRRRRSDRRGLATKLLVNKMHHPIASKKTAPPLYLSTSTSFGLANARLSGVGSASARSGTSNLRLRSLQGNARIAVTLVD